MNIQTGNARRFAGFMGLLALVASLGFGPAASGAEVLMKETTLVQGSQSVTYAFDAQTAGTVTVQLDNISWPQKLSSLDFLATSASGVMASFSDGGTMTESFQVGPGAFFTHVTGKAGGALALGLYSVQLSFTPAVAPVPVPASGLLALAGLVAMGLWSGRFRLRRQAAV